MPPGTQLAEKQELVRNNGSEPASLDPHKVESDIEFNIISDLFEGLGQRDACGGDPAPTGGALGKQGQPVMDLSFTPRSDLV
ncbi:putative extracellular solute-binding protein [Klebsiella pneumoniae subsp. ozaenae]|uniref:Putative extracellular solute-binding protein n=1 Tax=Klebsiella pneumoniae subsp. ozaenae TaxID=574 RepID=A0A377ZYF9_KLEPO|nr:putative extracellular solute-binding protein [Klebsiella pneumoniae subsp. ozaenae]